MKLDISWMIMTKVSEYAHVPSCDDAVAVANFREETGVYYNWFNLQGGGSKMGG